MKLAVVLGAVLVSALVACSGSDDAAAEAPAAATTPAAPAADKNAPAAETAPAADKPATTTDKPATETTASTAETCETLAAKTTPAGKLEVTEANGFDLKAADVFATETDGELAIVLTDTLHECGYRANNLAHQSMNELRIKVKKKAGAAIVPGELSASGIEAEAGEACMPPPAPGEESFGSNGTAFMGGSVRGKVKITAKTATSVEGSVDITDWQGQATTFTFTAPICATAAADKEPACCAAKAEE